MPRLKVTIALSLFALLLVLAGCQTIDRPPEVPVTVMTYNVYVGSSAEPALETTNLFQIPVVVGELYGNVIASDFAARAAAIATIVKESQPHVIGLQEIELIRRQDPSDFLSNRSPNAEEIDLDYLEILMDALHAEGLDYQVAAKVQNLDLEMPMLAGGKVTDVRLTDFDVILTRGDVVVSRPTAANYAAGLPIAPLGLEVARGYVAIDATIDDVTYRIVNTHLESVDPGPAGGAGAGAGGRLGGRGAPGHPPGGLQHARSRWGGLPASAGGRLPRCLADRFREKRSHLLPGGRPQERGE